MFRALAKNGGVVGVNFGSSFLNQKDAEELKQLIAKHNQTEPNLTGAELDQFAAKYHAESGEINPKTGAATVDDAAECIDISSRWRALTMWASAVILMGFPACPKGWRMFRRCRL
jgi:hypothetical protein